MDDAKKLAIQLLFSFSADFYLTHLMLLDICINVSIHNLKKKFKIKSLKSLEFIAVYTFYFLLLGVRRVHY